MKLKKTLIVLLVCIAVVLFAVLLYNSKSIIPKADNINRAEDIITNFYSCRELDLIMNENYDCEFLTIEDLSKQFELECVRDPREYSDCSGYLPYVVLMDTSGRKAFVFYSESQNGDHVIEASMVVDKFVPKDEMLSQIKSMKDNNAPYEEWEKLYKYFSGTFSGAVNTVQSVAVKEGVFVVWLTYSEYPIVKDIAYYSDETLLSKSGISNERYEGDVFPILPIDKLP